VKAVHQRQPDTRIVYISINPSVARWNQEAKAQETNRLIRKYIEASASRSEKLSFLDSHEGLLSAEGKPRSEILRADGLHLNARGYKEWTAILKPQILALWKADTK
jgi:lysophospholipase L1-like esterase